MRTFMMASMIPAITAFMAPFIVPLAILVAVVAGAVAVFTSIKAGIDEFKKSLDEGDSMLTAIIEGVSTALLTLVTLPITLIKNFVAWVAEKLGFEGIAEKLKEFSIVDFIKDGIKNLVTKAKDFVLGLFDIDFKGLLGKGLDILGAIMTRIKAIAAAGFAAVKAAFPGGESPAEAFSRVYQERIATSEASEPDVDETMAPIEQKQGDVDYASIMPEEKSKAELQREGTAKILAQDPTLSKSEARKMYIAEDKASNINNVIQTTNSPTTNNSSSNTTQTGDLAVDGSDNTAKYLAAMA
jgi:hypothetical protein